MTVPRLASITGTRGRVSLQSFRSIKTQPTEILRRLCYFIKSLPWDCCKVEAAVPIIMQIFFQLY